MFPDVEFLCTGDACTVLTPAVGILSIGTAWFSKIHVVGGMRPEVFLFYSNELMKDVIEGIHADF